MKVPFPLTQGFRSMLQRGVELSTLDVSYVSSLSWYFLVMFGIRGLMVLLLGETMVAPDMMQMQVCLCVYCTCGRGYVVLFF